MKGGGQCVTTNGQINILQWCAGTSASVMLLEVGSYIIIIFKKSS